MQGAEVAGKVVSYVGEFILGGIAMLAIGVALWAIRELKAAHKDHVGALEKAGGQHLEMHKAYQESNSETVAAISRLIDIENAQTNAITNTTATLGDMRSQFHGVREEVSNLRRSYDDTVREMVRLKKISSDRYPAHRDTRDKGER